MLTPQDDGNNGVRNKSYINFKRGLVRSPDVVSVRDFLIKNKDFCFIFHPSGNSLSWISFSLGIAVRFAFAGAHFIPRSPGFTRPEIRCLGLLAVQKFLHSVLICFANPTPSNFFTGRRSFISFGQPSQNPPLGLLAFTRFSIPFRIFILKILHFINLVHMGTGFGITSHGVPAQNPQKKALIFH